MSDKLFLQFPDIKDNHAEGCQVRWFYMSDDQLLESGSQSMTELLEIKAKFPETSIIVLVPSNDCLVTRVAIPSQQRRQQLKAIPFAVEEQLADDIEEMHFSIGKRLTDGQLPVIAVSRKKMQKWLQILAEANISATAILPIVGLLEAPKDSWSIFQLNDLFLVNQNGISWSATADEALMMLNLSIQQLADENKPDLLFWGEEEAPTWVSELGLNISEQQVKDSYQALFARFDRQSLNLLQGDFEIQDDWHASWKIWRRAAIFVILAIVLKFSMLGFDYYRLSAEKNYLQQEITNVYHQVAPGARISAYPEKQMQQLLQRLQGGQNQSSSFLMMLSHLGEGLTIISDINPTNLSYDSAKGEIKLDLLVSNLPVLDQLKDLLVSKGLSVEMGGASSQGKDYSGRLIIRSGS